MRDSFLAITLILARRELTWAILHSFWYLFVASMRQRGGEAPHVVYGDSALVSFVVCGLGTWRVIPVTLVPFLVLRLPLEGF